MLANKKYEWMIDYIAPVDSEFSCGVSRCLYWMYMYMKVMHQGTQEDKYALVKLYDEGTKNCMTVNTPWYSFNFNIHFYYKYAVSNFVRRTVHEAYEDDQKRKRMIDEINIERKNRELEKKIYGYDPKEVEMNESLYENELDAKNINNHERNDRVEDEKGYSIIPTYEDSCKMEIINSGTTTVNVIGKGNIAIHYKVFDKFHGFYGYLVWSDARQLDVNADYSALFGACIRYSGKLGAMDYVRKLINQERLSTIANDFRNHSDKNVKTKKAKIEAPNIDKINKALGLDNTNEDLNGDIF